MKICDSHNDFLTGIKKTEDKIKYIKKEIVKNRKIKFICAYVWTSKLKNPVKHIKKIYKNFFIDNKLYKYSKTKKHKIIFCLEGLDFVNKANVDDMLKIIKLIKPFCCGLVWNYNNNLCGGALGKNCLNRLGRKVVYFLENNNILVDTAHMNRKTFYDFCKITTKPIYNSHSNIHSLKNHPRNLTSKQIKTIINSDGFIGLSFVNKFISDKILDSHDIALQIKYFIEKYGDDNVGIGSDFFGTAPLPNRLTNYGEFKNLKKDLKILGLSRVQIKKIFYKNFVNFKNRVSVAPVNSYTTL